MASKLIGRTACPECGFSNAHVKLKTDDAPEGKKRRAYRHCPECGAQWFPTNDGQELKLIERTRKEGEPAQPAATAPADDAPPPKKRKSLADLLD